MPPDPGSLSRLRAPRTSGCLCGAEREAHHAGVPLGGGAEFRGLASPAGWLLLDPRFGKEPGLGLESP